MRRLFVALALALCAAYGLNAYASEQAAGGGRSGGSNTWTARSSSGRTFSGTWTVKLDAASGSATGEWTLFGADGKAAMHGGWSAAKAARGWNGAWRAVVIGRNGEFAGTWKAGLDLPADAPFSRLFERAADDIVSGTWQIGRQSGAWSIRVFD